MRLYGNRGDCAVSMQKQSEFESASASASLSDKNTRYKCSKMRLIFLFSSNEINTNQRLTLFSRYIVCAHAHSIRMYAKCKLTHTICIFTFFFVTLWRIRVAKCIFFNSDVVLKIISIFCLHFYFENANASLTWDFFFVRQKRERKKRKKCDIFHRSFGFHQQ